MIGSPIVTPDEMAALEKSIDSEAAMEVVAQNIAHFIASQGWKKVTLLVGKGNNGGDGARIAQVLFKRGLDVELHYIPGKGSLLREKHLKNFQGKKIELERFTPTSGLIIDALLGTGFKGPLDSKMEAIIRDVQGIVYSIDIPSGLNGMSGGPEPVAIRADTTLYCGLPKVGFFLGSGFAYVGLLHPVPIGFDLGALSSWHLLEYRDVKRMLPPINRLRHKFEAGSVSGVIASSQMAGAGILSSLASFRAGAGYLRLAFTGEGRGAESLAPLEAVKIQSDSIDDVIEALNSSSAAFIGPGLPESAECEKLVRAVLEGVNVPIVIDGGALFHLAKMPDLILPKQAVLTPHRGEMNRLAQLTGEKEDIETCRIFAEQRGITLVLKGAPTWIFHPGEPVLISPYGDPGMATAGSGDVLTGIIAAELAAGLETREAAALGVALHGMSGMLAAKELSSYSLMARDLIDYLPKALKLL